MERDRMEAFSDGVLAIIITIMVLNLHIPAGNTFKDFMTEMPKIGIYAMSFFLLRLAIVRCDECSHILREAMENDRRGKFTGIIYIIALGLSFCAPRVAVALHTMLLILWFIPDKNIEQAIYSADREKNGE